MLAKNVQMTFQMPHVIFLKPEMPFLKKRQLCFNVKYMSNFWKIASWRFLKIRLLLYARTKQHSSFIFLLISTLPNSNQKTKNPNYYSLSQFYFFSHRNCVILMDLLYNLR